MLPTGRAISAREVILQAGSISKTTKLWEEDYKSKNEAPTLAQLMSDHLDLDKGLSKELDEGIENDTKERMY